MYRNVVIDGWRWLTVEIDGKVYLLGRTGRPDWCQNLGATRSDLQ